MIVIKNSQLNSETLLVLNKLMDMEMNAKLAFKLMKIMKEMSSLVDDKLKLERRILDRHSEKSETGETLPGLDDHGNPIPGAIKVKDSDAFNKEMYELMLLENEVGYDKVNFEELNLTTIKVKDLMQIEFLFN
jgi:hypothetical protein